MLKLSYGHCILFPFSKFRGFKCMAHTPVRHFTCFTEPVKPAKYLWQINEDVVDKSTVFPHRLKSTSNWSCDLEAENSSEAPQAYSSGCCKWTTIRHLIKSQARVSLQERLHTLHFQFVSQVVCVVCLFLSLSKSDRHSSSPQSLQLSPAILSVSTSNYLCWNFDLYVSSESLPHALRKKSPSKLQAWKSSLTTDLSAATAEP